LDEPTITGAESESLMGLQEALKNLWENDFVQKNPTKAYKVTYANEYTAVAAYLSGGPEPDWSGFSKLGKGLCETEKHRRAEVIVVPPVPPSGTLPAVIDRGGTYSGSIKVNQSTPAVRITTSEPVTINASLIENLGNGGNLECFAANADVTIKGTTFNGGVWRAINARGFKKFRIENNNFNKTWGIRLDNCVSGGSIHFLRNKGVNTQYYNQLSHFFQCGNMPSTASIEVAWNEHINEFGKSLSEDVISIFASHNARVHNNYVQGAYPMTTDGTSPGASAYRGGGILCGDGGGDDNWIFDNQIVDCQNYIVAISGGARNRVFNNRGFSDSQRFTKLSSGGQGGVIYGYGGHQITQAEFKGNTLGCIRPGGARSDWWVSDPATVVNNFNADNTHYSGAFDIAAEFAAWQAKCVANGITVGV
jgi:hypothetical protein